MKCAMLSRLAIALLVSVLPLTATAAGVYFTETGFGDTVSRVSPLPGVASAGLTTLATLPGLDPRGVAVDGTHGHVYHASGSSIVRTRLDGSDAMTILTAPAAIGDIEVDPANGKVYFSTIFSPPTDAIYSADLDGGSVTKLHDAASLAAAGALATITTRDVFNIKVDSDAGLLYWSADDGGVAGRTALNVTPVGGGGASQLWVAGSRADAITKMAIDFASDTLYYTVGSTTNEVRRASLDNSGMVSLVAGLGRPGALDIDISGGNLYFWIGATLYQGSLDGTGLSSQTFSGSSLYAVSDMALGPLTVVPLPPALFALGAGFALLLRLRKACA
ncbi:MAG: hypothetical protein RLW61_03560 [Gammaproteobacteria bacterium]